MEPMIQVATVKFECLKLAERHLHGCEHVFPISQVVVKFAQQLADGTVDKSELYKYRNE